MFAYCNNCPTGRVDATGNVSQIEKGNGIIDGKDSHFGVYSGPYAMYANCYAYAFSFPVDPRTGMYFTSKPQPGEFSGTSWDSGFESNKNLDPSKVKRAILSAVKRDGKELGFVVLAANYSTCSSSENVRAVALAYSPTMGDYHWWKQSVNGTWTHKPGEGPIMTKDYSGKTIYDPSACNRWSYTEFLGYFLIIRESRGITK